MPVWGRRLGLAAVLRWLADYRAYLAICPLWRDLCRALPEVALEPPADRAVQAFLPPRDLRLRLYRCLVEVLDARLLLRASLDPRAGELATDAWQRRRGHSASPELPAFLEAVALEAALRARAADRPPEGPGTLLAVPTNGGVGDELRSFCRVAHQRARSALLRHVMARLAVEAGHATDPSSSARVNEERRAVG
jgi:hypothetical protein